MYQSRHMCICLKPVLLCITVCNGWWLMSVQCVYWTLGQSGQRKLVSHIVGCSQGERRLENVPRPATPA